MKFTWRFEIPNLIQDRTAGLQSLGGLIQPPPALIRVKEKNPADNLGETPLHIAAIKGYLEI